MVRMGPQPYRPDRVTSDFLGEAMSLRFSSFRRNRHGVLFSGRRTINRPHMVYTEVQDLDEALDVLMDRRRARRGKHPRHKAALDAEFATRPRRPITLPKLKFMEPKE